MASVALDPKEATLHRLAAAKVVIAHHQWREDFETNSFPAQLAQLLGDDRKAKAWLEAQLAEVEQRIVAGSPAALDDVEGLEATALSSAPPEGSSR